MDRCNPWFRSICRDPLGKHSMTQCSEMQSHFNTGRPKSGSLIETACRIAEPRSSRKSEIATVVAARRRRPDDKDIPVARPTNAGAANLPFGFYCLCHVKEEPREYWAPSDLRFEGNSNST
mmetsp:Transcript_21960/g.68126  ORF Transcript_21960/g.68126 Transcript_21960/m.68126 type:complete len:121 (-) Transcript_21960:82-444(-)